MGNPYLEEILEQPAAVHRAVDGYPSACRELDHVVTRARDGSFRHIVLTGMGSSLYSSYPLWLALCQAGIPATMWDASELAHHGGAALTGTLLIAVSQSGETVELRRLAELDRRPSAIISITNGMQNSLTSWADVGLDTCAGSEGTVSTKTFAAGVAVLYLLGCQLMGRDLPAAQRDVRQAAEQARIFLADGEQRMQRAIPLLEDSDALAFIGRGPSLATVMTGALITSEASKVFTVGLTGGQFRHGPLELAREGFKALIFAGLEPTAELNWRLAGDIARFGGTVVVIDSGSSAPAMSGIERVVIEGSQPMLLPINEMLPVQLLTIALARQKGIEPGAFERGSKVTSHE